MPRPKLKFLTIIIPSVLWLIMNSLVLAERELYFTDFENAPSGDNELVGYDGWSGTSNGRGSHGIEPEAVQGLGQSAFIGYNSPGGNTDTVTVLRQIRHNPDSTGEHIVRLETVVGINDSDGPGNDPRRDSFFISFFNSNGTNLASLTYNNTETSFGLWREDGRDKYDTGEEFIRNEIQILAAEVDFKNNTWSVDLSGFQIFEDAPFTARNTKLDLGGIAIVWQRTSNSGWGNNWMLFDDWTVYADTKKLTLAENPFKIRSITRQPNGKNTISWKMQPGFNYQIEYSDDLRIWKSNLPGSLLSSDEEQITNFTDNPNSINRTRQYRVYRSEQ
jgi:hypothetical protein